MSVREWSSITGIGGGGGYKTGLGGGGDLPYKKGEGTISFSHPEGGEGTKSVWVVLTQVLEVLTILEGGGGGHNRLSAFKKGGGSKRFNPVLGGGRKKIRTCNFVKPPPLPVINDQSLNAWQS